MKINQIYTELKKLSDLTPGPEVNALFENLVAWAVGLNVVQDDTLNSAEREDLQDICSRAEYEMEKYWAQKIISGEGLEQFWYYNNYSELTHLEWSSVCYCKEHSHTVLFIGGGPLPMTSIILAKEHGVSSVVLEKDMQAYQLSKKVIETLGLQEKVKIVLVDAFEYKEYHAHNTIFVAALVGSDDDKKIKLFEYIKEHSGEHVHLVARSAWGKREYLYKKLPEEIFSIFKPIIKIDPYTDIVNSIIIFKK